MIMGIITMTTTREEGGDFGMIATIAMILAFLNTTAVGLAGNSQRIIKTSRFMLLLPGLALVVLLVVGIIRS